MVHCHRSQKEQVNGHSAPTRNAVSARSIFPSGPRAGVATHASAAVPARIRERVLDRIHAPALLIEHAVVHYAAYRQLAVSLDRVILEVLVAAVAIDQ